MDSDRCSWNLQTKCIGADCVYTIVQDCCTQAGSGGKPVSVQDAEESGNRKKRIAAFFSKQHESLGATRKANETILGT